MSITRSCVNPEVAHIRLTAVQHSTHGHNTYWEGSEWILQLLIQRLNMVKVDMRITHCLNEISWLEPTNLQQEGDSSMATTKMMLRQR